MAQLSSAVLKYGPAFLCSLKVWPSFPLQETLGVCLSFHLQCRSAAHQPVSDPAFAVPRLNTPQFAGLKYGAGRPVCSLLQHCYPLLDTSSSIKTKAQTRLYSNSKLTGPTSSQHSLSMSALSYVFSLVDLLKKILIKLSSKYISHTFRAVVGMHHLPVSDCTTPCPDVWIVVCWPDCLVTVYTAQSVSAGRTSLNRWLLVWLSCHSVHRTVSQCRQNEWNTRPFWVPGLCQSMQRRTLHYRDCQLAANLNGVAARSGYNQTGKRNFRSVPCSDRL